MDLNPFPGAVWTTEEGPYELAQYVIDENTNLLIVLCAWLDSKKDLDSRWDLSTLNYWLARLRPLWKRPEASSPKHSDTIVVMCNRSGAEGGQCTYKHRLISGIAYLLFFRNTFRRHLSNL